MVNFQSDEALKVPITDIKRQLILEKREKLAILLTSVWSDNQMTSDEVNLIRARTLELFNEIEENIKRNYPKKYTEIVKAVNSLDFKELDKGRKMMEEIIYDITETNKIRFY